MENQPTIEEAMDEITCGCPGCLSVPLSVLALEVPMPLTGWDGLFEQHGIKVITDHIGREAIAAAAARRLLVTLRRQEELVAESRDRRWRRRHSPILGGVPPIEGGTPLEALAAAPGYQLPSDEFKGIPRPRFLDEALMEGARADAEKKKRAAEEKERAAAKLKEDLR